MAELRATAKEYAKAYAQKEYLEEFKKSKLAQQMKIAEGNGYATAAAQEREARVSQDYINLLEGLRDAQERSMELSWQLKLAEVAIDIWRTKESSKRAERKGYGA